MSKLLEDLIRQSRADTAEYEEFLRQAEALAKRLVTKQSTNGAPSSLHGKREATVIFNNLGSLPRTTFVYPPDVEAQAALALRIDTVIRENAPAGYRGDQAREAQVKNALFKAMNQDREATAALFEIIKQQKGYG